MPVIDEVEVETPVSKPVAATATAAPATPVGIEHDAIAGIDGVTKFLPARISDPNRFAP
jgi:hypothetical protein